jgi:sulfite reductase alpha subunit-like flavoprotein
MNTQSPGQARSALILYGSETGNAQEVAEELGALAERLRFATHVSELNQSKPVSCIDREWVSTDDQLTYFDL